MHVAVIVGAAVLGLLVGSFLNVVISRVPLRRSVVRPGSACPACETPIAARDNVPLLSYVVLRGRCRACGTPISWRYPAVELVTAAAFAGTAARFDWSWALPAYLVVTAGLIALGVIDLERKLLPVRVVYPTLALTVVLLGVGSAGTHAWTRLWWAAGAAAVWAGLFLAINLASPRLLGRGDVRLALVTGVALGWLGYRYALIGFLAGNVVGLAAGLVLIATGRATRTTPIPYGLFLALGTFVALYAGQPIVEHFLLR